MEEKDAWSVHVEYLKLAIALSTAVIAATVAIYVDNSKIPTGQIELCGFALTARLLLLLGVGSFLGVLVTSLLTVMFLANHFVTFQSSPLSRAAAWVKIAATAAATASASTEAIKANIARKKAETETDPAASAELLRIATEAAAQAAAARAAAELAAKENVPAAPSARKSIDAQAAIWCARLSLLCLALAVLSLFLLFLARSRVEPAIVDKAASGTLAPTLQIPSPSPAPGRPPPADAKPADAKPADAKPAEPPAPSR
ncbi:MAG: hypothetical protein ACRED3_17375 [Bradyrhizobium sp.]